MPSGDIAKGINQKSAKDIPIIHTQRSVPPKLSKPTTTQYETYAVCMNRKTRPTMLSLLMYRPNVKGEPPTDLTTVC